MGANRLARDGAAIMNQVMRAAHFVRSVCTPRMVRICKKKVFTSARVMKLCAYSRRALRPKEMAQDALNRFRWPTLMMFGPRECGINPIPKTAIKWKIKGKANDELRQRSF